MPQSRGRRTPKKRKATRPRPPSFSVPSGPFPTPPIPGLVKIIMKGDDLAGEEDPFMAELWASGMLGTFYKMPLPLHVRDEFETSLAAGLIAAFQEAQSPKQLAVLRAFAAIAPPPIGPAAQTRAEELVQQGVADPPWATQIGKPEFVDAWLTQDPYGDQRGYYARFRYPGRDPHTMIALYDVNLGGIVKDSSFGYTKGDLRSKFIEDRMEHVEVDPQEMATEILAGIAMGDMYIDNAWTEDFKKTRALLLARMSELVDEMPASIPEEREPVTEETRKALVAEFVRSGHSTGSEAEESILDHCLTYRCDYCDGDPLRWSPIAVELFMVDFLPRKVSLDTLEVRALPPVLKAWVRFALTKRGLEERWIADAEAAVDRWAPEFKKQVTDPENFGMAKAMGHAMMSAGVDLTDQRAVDRWIEVFNQRPFEERDEFLRDR